jgi:hypothetical protein
MNIPGYPLSFFLLSLDYCHNMALFIGDNGNFRTDVLQIAAEIINGYSHMGY